MQSIWNYLNIIISYGSNFAPTNLFLFAKITNNGSDRNDGDDDSIEDHIPEVGGRSLKGGALRQISTNAAHRTFVDWVYFSMHLNVNQYKHIVSNSALKIWWYIYFPFSCAKSVQTLRIEHLLIGYIFQCIWTLISTNTYF